MNILVATPQCFSCCFLFYQFMLKKDEHFILELLKLNWFADSWKWYFCLLQCGATGGWSIPEVVKRIEDIHDKTTDVAKWVDWVHQLTEREMLQCHHPVSSQCQEASLTPAIITFCSFWRTPMLRHVCSGLCLLPFPRQRPEKTCWNIGIQWNGSIGK